MPGLVGARVAQDTRQVGIDALPIGAQQLGQHMPRSVHITVVVVLMECESIERGGAPAVAIANAQQESAQVMAGDVVHHGGGIMSAGASKAQLVVGMPLANVLQAVALDNHLPHTREVVHVLIKEGGLVIGPRTGADGILHNGDAGGRPVAEKLTAGLDERAVEYAARDVVQLALEHHHHRGRLALVGQSVARLLTRGDYGQRLLVAAAIGFQRLGHSLLAIPWQIAMLDLLKALRLALFSEFFRHIICVFIR